MRILRYQILITRTLITLFLSVTSLSIQSITAHGLFGYHEELECANTHQSREPNQFREMLEAHLAPDPALMRDGFTITVRPTYKRYFYNREDTENRVEALAVVTIRNKKARVLEALKLNWHSEASPLDRFFKKVMHQITASLYRNDKKGPLNAIEDNFVANGSWDRDGTLVFPVNKKIIGIEEFFIMLSYPPHLRRLIHEGNLTYQSKSGLSTTLVENEKKEDKSPEKSDKKETSKPAS